MVGVDLIPQFLTTAVVQPGVHFSGGHAKWHGGEELGSRDFTAPVVRRGVTHFSRASGDGIKDFQCRYQLACTVNANAHAAVRELFHTTSKVVSTGTQGGEILRPGGDHIPGVGFVSAGGRNKGGSSDTGGTQAGGFQKLAALHGGHDSEIIGCFL